MKAVYISGPITKGDQFANVGAAIRASAMVRNLGHAPLCPHLTAFEHMFQSQTWEHWIAADLVWVRKADCVYLLPGESRGAEIEVAEAKRCGIPVFTDAHELHFFLASA